MLRAAREADFVPIHALYTHPAVIPFMAHDPMPLADFRPLFDTLRTTGLMVWEVGDRIAGMYRISLGEGRGRHIASLSAVAVHPEFHGSGLARIMLEDNFSRLRERGVRRVELYAEADNARGLAFYRKLGFDVVAVMTDAYRAYGRPGYVDDILMAKLLD